MEGSHTSWSHDAVQAAEWETYNRGSGEERTRGGEGARLAASYPHQPTYSLSTSFLHSFNPLSRPDEAVRFNQMLRRQKPKRTRAAIGVRELRRK